MIELIVVLVVLGLLFSIFGQGRDARRTRESQERLEKHVISQLPPPTGFEDVPADAIAAVRDGRRLQAIMILHKQCQLDVDTAKARVNALTVALKAGPALGRPPSGLFG